MAKTIVNVSFTLTVPPADYERAVAPLAQAIADTAGLEWKIWLVNAAEQSAGGVYLFADAVAAQAFLEGPLVAQVKAAPIVADMQARVYAVMDELTAITHGPVMVEARAA